MPVEIQNLTQLEYIVLNYNSLDGMFPIAVAPPLITVCLVQPNAFTACPPNVSVETATTLAYQCNLDCRGEEGGQTRNHHLVFLLLERVSEH